MSDIDIEAIEKLIDEATEAPFEIDGDDPCGVWGRSGSVLVGDMTSSEDARLLVAVRNSIQALIAEVRRLRVESHEETEHVEKLRGILIRTANALKGEPAPLTLHSWHDLDEVGAKLRAENEQMREQIAKTRDIAAAIEEVGALMPLDPERKPGPRAKGIPVAGKNALRRIAVSLARQRGFLVKKWKNAEAENDRLRTKVAAGERLAETVNNLFMRHSHVRIDFTTHSKCGTLANEALTAYREVKP